MNLDLLSWSPVILTLTPETAERTERQRYANLSTNRIYSINQTTIQSFKRREKYPERKVRILMSLRFRFDIQVIHGHKTIIKSHCHQHSQFYTKKKGTFSIPTSSCSGKKNINCHQDSPSLSIPI